MAKDKVKAWYDEIDTATLQRLKTYSAFNDATSKNLMMQTMYEYREKEIQDFKETNHELAETCIARKKRIDKLERKISVLLSCQNCPENKGGLICQKEYENKCLSQKIQYIKELKEENAELKEKLYGSRLYAVNEKLNADILLLEKLNKEQKEHIKTLEYRCESIKDTDTMELVALQKKLTKAKEIIKSFSEFANNEVEYDSEHPQEHTDLWNKLCEQAEQFLKEVE